MADDVRGDYFFRVHSYATGGKTPNDKSPSVGHFGIELVDPNGKSLNLGLYPRTNADPESNHTGIIRNDGKMKAGFSNLESSEKITLTPEQGEKMRAFLINAMENPGDYSLLGRNCEEFVQESLKASGIKARTEDFMTDKQRAHFNLAKLTMNNPDEDPKLRHAQDARRADQKRHELQPMDFETREEYERYIAQQRGPDNEQKRPAPDAAKDAGRDAGPDQHSDAGDASQQQQLADADAGANANAEANVNAGIDTADIDTGGGNNGRNYAAELAALPPGRAVRLNWLLQKSPDQWTQQELDDAQASRPYWDSRAPRHDEVQAAVSDVYRYTYGDGSRGFRPDGSLPRAEPINKLLDAALPDSASAGNSLMPQQRLQAWPETGPETGWPQTGPRAWPQIGPRAWPQTGPLGRLPTGTPPFIPEGPQFPEWQLRRQYDLADLGALMEDIPLFDSRLFQDQERARSAPARYLQQAINSLLWPGKAAPTVAGIQGKPYKSGPILVDGEIGPVTAQALDQVEVMPDGLAALSQGVKRNAARDLVRSIAPDMPTQPLAGQQLARQLDQAVSLFRDPAQPHANSVRHL